MYRNSKFCKFQGYDFFLIKRLEKTPRGFLAVFSFFIFHLPLSDLIHVYLNYNILGSWVEYFSLGREVGVSLAPSPDPKSSRIRCAEMRSESAIHQELIENRPVR